MSRGLLPSLSVLLLAASVWAGGPDDLFDARVAGALQPGQKESILALDNGRYMLLKNGHFQDSRPVDPAHPLLTNKQVAELLAGGKKIPPLPASVVGTTVVQPIAPTSNQSPYVIPNFDGGTKREGDIRGPPDGAVSGGIGGKSASDVLHAKFLTRLTITGDKKEREALGEAIGSILKTKTGRELAEAFVNEGASAEIKMRAFEGGKVVEKNGVKVLSGVAGITLSTENPPKAVLSLVYLDTDPEFRRVAMAGTLAHELFGHAFEKQRADKAGLPEVARHHYRGDEVGSRLIDWMVQTELAGKVVDSDAGPYLSDPEGYYRGLLTVHPYYATTLSLTEMKNPVDTLRARRKMIVAEEAGNDKDLKDMEGWTPVIAHFVSTHTVAKVRFKTVEASIKSLLDYSTDRMTTLAEIRKILDNHIDFWSSPEGKAERAALIGAADAPYLKRQEAAAAARAKELRQLRASRGSASTNALELPGMVINVNVSGEPEIDLAELGRMRAQDKRKNPGHWTK